jgi:hypothetical protein
LSSIRNILASNILNAFESTKASLEAEKQNGIIVATKDNDLEKRQILVRINEAKEQKLILESGNNSTGERGLLQINKDIEKISLNEKPSNNHL